MSSDKYINYYIDTLVATLTDCVVRNVSLQANAKVTDDVIGDQQKKIVGLQNEIEEGKKLVEEANQAKLQSDNEIIRNLERINNDQKEHITKLNVELNSLGSIRNENQNLKNQLNGLESLRNENQTLRKDYETRKQEFESVRQSYESTIAKNKEEYELNIDRLNKKIQQLQSEKKKKVNVNPTEVKTSDIEQPTEPHDGGEF